MQLCKGKRRLTDQGWRHAKKNCLPHEGRFVLAFHALHIHLHPFSCLLQPQMKIWVCKQHIHQLHCQLVTEVWRRGNLVCEQPSRNLAWQKLEILHNNNQQNCLTKGLSCAKRLDFKHYQETVHKIVYSLKPLQLRKAESVNSSVMTIRFADRWLLS